MQTELRRGRRVILQTEHAFLGTLTDFRRDEFQVTYDGAPRVKGGRYWYPLSSLHMFVDIDAAVREVLERARLEVDSNG